MYFPSIDGAYIIHWLKDDTFEGFVTEEEWEKHIAEIEATGYIEGKDFHAYYDYPQW